MHSHLAIALIAGLASAALAAPPFTLTIELNGRTQSVPDLGILQSAGGFGTTTPNPFRAIAINNDGDWVVQVNAAAAGDEDEGLLRSDDPGAAYLAKGYGPFGDPSTGLLTVPTSDHAPLLFHRLDVTDAGDIVSIMSVGQGFFGPVVTSTSGVFLNRDTILIEEGTLSTAFVEPTTWQPFDDASCCVAPGGDVLVIAQVSSASLATRRAAILLEVNAGTVTSQTLIAQEGDILVGGAMTWETISAGVNAASCNDAGDVLLSGTLVGGGSVIALNNAIVAIEGGPAPDGLQWGALDGAPCDLNGAGDLVFRAQVTDGAGVWTETGDAGEDPDSRVDIDVTQGSGELQRIDGTLVDDHDVDTYRIIIDDPAAFLATTEPGMGSTGAGFDTVLSLFRSPAEGGRAVARDDDNPASTQSTITGADVPVPGEYNLVISTAAAVATGPREHPGIDAFIEEPLWANDPAALIEHEGTLYWIDHARAVIRRASIAGTILSDIPVGRADGASLAILDDVTGDKLYWFDRDADIIMRANLDGTAMEPNASAFTQDDVAGLAAASSAADIYYTRKLDGFIIRANADGTGESLVIGFGPGDANGTDPTHLVIDEPGSRLFWIAPASQRIMTAGLDGSGLATFVSGVAAGDLAIDAVGAKLYWTSPATGAIQRRNLDGTGSTETTVTANAPAGIAVDAAGAFVYWTEPATGMIRRHALPAGTPEDVVDAELGTDQRLADGLAANAPLTAWTRAGTPTPGALPYQIRLEGAAFAEPRAMIARGDNTKVVGSGDTLTDLAQPIVRVGAPTGPVHIGDDGGVVWWGLWDAPTLANNGAFTGLFRNTDLLLQDVDTFVEPEPAPPAPLPGNVTFVPSSDDARHFDLSSDGRQLLARVNTFTSFPLTPFEQGDLLLRFAFEAQACPCELDGDDAQVDVFDLLAYLALWFVADPGAACDAVPIIDVFDLLCFLDCWFTATAGGPCP